MVSIDDFKIKDEKVYWSVLIGGGMFLGGINGFVFDGFLMILTAIIIGILWAILVLSLRDSSLSLS